MGMEIEVVGKIYYTVYLTDEEVERVRKWIEDRQDNLPSFDMKENICVAVSELFSSGEIELYSDGKATESDFCTEEIKWSEFEERTAEEILENI